MKQNRWVNSLKVAVGCFITTVSFFQSLDACTRILFTGSDDVVITGRSMDWSEDMNSNLWLFPKGMDRNSAGGAHAFNWKSKYGSVVVAGYELGSADGMNEKGLVANLLYLAESDYGTVDGVKPVLSISAWAQYVLDNFATVDESVIALSKETFQIAAPMLPSGVQAQLHLSISDATGDSAVFEYIDKKLVIHQGKQYQVMTNSPTYDQQLVINKYWETVGGSNFLPGTYRATDRFARASFFLNAIPKKINPKYITAVPDKSFINQAIASVMGIVRAVSVPIGVTSDLPNIASTLWRTVSDQKNKVYYFDSATTPNTFWVNFNDLDLGENAKPKKLDLSNKVYAGNVVKDFVEEKPFVFLPVKS